MKKRVSKKQPALNPLFKKIGKVFDTRIRPMLQADGGDVEILSLKGKTLTVRLVGACGSCPYGLMTLQYGIQTNIDDAFPKEKIIVELGG